MNVVENLAAKETGHFSGINGDQRQNKKTEDDVKRDV